MTQSETRKRKHTPDDLAALEQRARDFASVTGKSTKSRLENQARYAYALSLEFYEVGVFGADYVRWLSRHSGMPRQTCWRRVKVGRALSLGMTGRESSVLTEQRRKEKTPRPELEWGEISE